MKHGKKKRAGRNRQIALPWFLLFLLLALAPQLAHYLLIVIFSNAPTLGWWFVPVLVVYFTLLVFLLALILRRHELREMRALLGDETFYEKFPKERRREEKRLGHPLDFTQKTPEALHARQAELMEKHVAYRAEKLAAQQKKAHPVSRPEAHPDHKPEE